MPEPVTPREWLAFVREAEASGDYLTAFDRARHGLEAHPGDLWLRHRAVLAVARSGARDRALELWDEYELGERTEQDVAALRARIEKDEALVREGKERTKRAANAADLYEAIYERTKGSYPGVNAATMWMLAGEADKSRALATEILKNISDEETSYYRAATEAEAALLLGDTERAREQLKRAGGAYDLDHAALATTRRQLRWVCDLLEVDNGLLDELPSPQVAHYTGHRICAPGETGRFPASAESAVAKRIQEAIAKQDIRYGFGSLACGADILFAEALREHGAEFEVVLPFDVEEFKERSVVSGGANWVERFDDCLGAAKAIHYATEDQFLGDELLFGYAAELAMGLAVVRGRHLDTSVHQLAVWDQQQGPTGSAGTAHDVSLGTAKGLTLTIIPSDPDATPKGGPVTARKGGRAVRAMLFGDIKGFSKLSESHLPIFLSEILGAFGTVLNGFGKDVLYRNTWGDGLYCVFRDVVVAAECALGLQEAMNAIDLEAVGLPPHLALRVGAHVGPVFAGQNPVLERTVFYGSHVTRTARVEPATPPGHVYVTEPFAAILAMKTDRLETEYVGQMPAAKGYGTMRMYVLK